MPKTPSSLAWSVDSLTPTMREWEPSTAAIIEGEGVIAVAIRSTGPSNRISRPRWSVMVNPAAPAPSPRRRVRRGVGVVRKAGGMTRSGG
ncbi:hypothetical protein ACWGS5_22370 [Streptomyces albidoflavus]